MTFSASPNYYKHTRLLHPHRQYAENLPSDLISALTYSEKQVLLYVLLKHQDKYYGLLYDPKTQQVRSPSSEKILDLIQCTSETEAAMVDPNQIEMLSDRCIRLWCHQHNIEEEKVIRECTLYLKPNDAEDSIQDLLTGDFQPWQFSTI